MLFLVDPNQKVIFGWSPKCGCSHIKNIYWFLRTDTLDHPIHTMEDNNLLPDDIENYTTILITRNPYKRLVSGFLDKYSKEGHYRSMWKSPFLSFSQFVDKLIQHDWDTIQMHHFIEQTSERFDKNRLLLSKTLKVFDLEKIDYEFIEQVYKKKIPSEVLNLQHGHERHLRVKGAKFYDTPVYDLHIDDYVDYNIGLQYFYNEEIRQKVFHFFMEDFNFFRAHGIDYVTTAEESLRLLVVKLNDIPVQVQAKLESALAKVSSDADAKFAALQKKIEQKKVKAGAIMVEGILEKLESASNEMKLCVSTMSDTFSNSVDDTVERVVSKITLLSI